MSRGMPFAVSFDFWNTLVLEPGGVLSEMRRQAVEEVLRGSTVELDPGLLDRHLAAAGSLHRVAWEAGSPFHPRDAAEVLLRELALEDEALGGDLVAAFPDAGREAELALAPGAAETLEALALLGVRLGIVCDVGLTGSQHLLEFLSRSGLLPHFSGWAFSDEVGHFKPNPAIFEHVLEQLEVRDPGAAMHVGDLRRTDVVGARSVGLFPVRYRGLADDRSELPEADWVIDDLSELLQGFPA